MRRASRLSSAVLDVRREQRLGSRATRPGSIGRRPRAPRIRQPWGSRSKANACAAALVQIEQQLERAAPDRLHRGVVRADHEALVAARGGLRQPGGLAQRDRAARAARRRPPRRCRRCRRRPRRRRASGSLQAGERRVAEALGRQRRGVRAVGGGVDRLPRDLQRPARARGQRLRPGHRGRGRLAVGHDLVDDAERERLRARRSSRPAGSGAGRPPGRARARRAPCRRSRAGCRARPRGTRSARSRRPRADRRPAPAPGRRPRTSRGSARSTAAAGGRAARRRRPCTRSRRARSRAWRRRAPSCRRPPRTRARPRRG